MTPIENPYTYIKELQSSFDYTQLKFYKEYYENLSEEEAELIPPVWKVYLEGGFYHHSGRERQGKEIKIEKRFSWYDETWYIPSGGKE